MFYTEIKRTNFIQIGSFYSEFLTSLKYEKYIRGNVNRLSRITICYNNIKTSKQIIYATFFRINGKNVA